MIKKFNKYKIIFSCLFIILSLTFSIKLYSNQNFQEYTKISVTYNNQPFESHRNFIKSFRNLDNYDYWLKNKNPTAEINDFIEEGVYTNENGYSSNSKLVFPKLRDTDATYFVVIKKTSNENLKNIKEYLEFTASKIENKYKKNYPFYNIFVSFPSKYYKKNFNPLIFFIIGGLILSLFSIAILLFLYEEIKSLRLLK